MAVKQSIDGRADREESPSTFVRGEQGRAFLSPTEFDNEAKVVRLTVPKLIGAAERDDVAPPGHARRLFELAAPPKDLFVIPGATHNDTYIAGGQQYLKGIRNFLESPGKP